MNPVLGAEYAAKLQQMQWAAEFELALKQREKKDKVRKYKHSFKCKAVVRRGK